MFNSINRSLPCVVSPLRNGMDIPFEVKRMYYIYDIPLFMQRGGHAHKNLQQIIIAIKGKFLLNLHDGNKSRKISLETPEIGLHLVQGIWRELFDFTPGAVCMVLASEKYGENDYIRSFDEFMAFQQQDESSD